MVLDPALLERSQDEALRELHRDETKSGGRRVRRFKCSNCPEDHPGFYTWEELQRHKKEKGH